MEDVLAVLVSKLYNLLLLEIEAVQVLLVEEEEILFQVVDNARVEVIKNPCYLLKVTTLN
jgi:hypothetical protein